ncbi:PREDICTED: rhophilin-2 isoform X1 [Bactrocera latifrons]|uniref:Rhophilin-2 n=1 Tax=Bactrocera latifrons TaxID=174628 RepID=A0A0K8WH86_BACLA|nr:PREDICTED: rhophilin-2 isoform X1 [Bactrocera latifrons]
MDNTSSSSTADTANSSGSSSTNSNSNNSDANLSFSFVRGSDPRAATCRGKLQSRRCKLNQEINKELRLRAGAENLFKATTNRKLRDTVALELSFVNSNLQLLKEQLAELNSSVEIYQSDSHENFMPMIPLGLKETKEISFMEPFSDLILEHYSEEPSLYVDAIADITDTRQASRTPSRDAQGVALLFRYYNLLYYVERRFFPPDRNLGVYFEWYDSLTGVPSCQRTIAFEKACTLFNLGAIYTQIGARHDRTTEKGLDAAVDSFLRAAGIFRHIYDTFTNAPSMDLKPQVLDVLVSLMLSQARECLFEKLQLQIEALGLTESSHLFKDLAGEAAQLTLEYNEMHKNIQMNDTHTYLPECWAGLVPLKAEFYKALAHHYEACSVDVAADKTSLSTKKSQATSHGGTANESFIGNAREALRAAAAAFDESEEDAASATALKRAHLKEALASHEETQRLQRMCRFLKNKLSLTQVLKEAHYKTQDEYEKFLEEAPQNDIQDDFHVIDAVTEACSKFTLSLTGPDFTSYKVEDPFKRLGPIAIFSARRHWTAPRCVRLQKGSSIYHESAHTHYRCHCPTPNEGHEVGCSQYKEDVESFGFHVRGDAPVIIAHVEINSLADLGGIKEGDFIVEIAGIDVKWYSHQQVVRLIQSCGSTLELKVITPMDRNYLKPLSSKGSISTLSAASSSGVSSGSSSPTGTTTKPKARFKTTSPKSRLGSLSSSSWNPFRRTPSLAKIF